MRDLHCSTTINPWTYKGVGVGGGQPPPKDFLEIFPRRFITFVPSVFSNCKVYVCVCMYVVVRNPPPAAFHHNDNFLYLARKLSKL